MNNEALLYYHRFHSLPHRGNQKVSLPTVHGSTVSGWGGGVVQVGEWSHFSHEISFFCTPSFHHPIWVVLPWRVSLTPHGAEH